MKKKCIASHDKPHSEKPGRFYRFEAGVEYDEEDYDFELSEKNFTTEAQRHRGKSTDKGVTAEDKGTGSPIESGMTDKKKKPKKEVK